MLSEFSTPEWVKDAVFYQIFPDRFASSPRVIKPSNLEAWDAPPTLCGFKGGDLLGVAEHLDYLQDLGVNAIYFTPIFQSASNHRYHTHDYHQVDPLLGGDAAFQTLLDEAHRRGMRVVLDGVFNHASRGFFQFNHILECGKSSPYLDWFTVYEYPLNAYGGMPNYDCWVNAPALPEFNHRNPQVREFLFNVARYWLERGIDGWRLDVPFEIKDDTFWQEFRQVVKSVNPDAYITGEIVLTDAAHWLQGDMFDAVMNYLLTYACWAFFAGESLNLPVLGEWKRFSEFETDASFFARNVERLLELYPAPAVAAQLNLLGSHDTPRMLTVASGNQGALRLATIFQMTYPGAPCIYYGDEIGMEGGRDPDCRRAFPWDETRWDRDLRGLFQRLVALRKQHPVLRRGDFHTLAANQGTYAYLRQGMGERFVIALNRSENTLHLDLPVNGLVPDGTVLRDQLSTTAPAAARVSNGRLSGLSIPPYRGVVLG